MKVKTIIGCILGSATAVAIANLATRKRNLETVDVSMDCDMTLKTTTEFDDKEDEAKCTVQNCVQWWTRPNPNECRILHDVSLYTDRIPDKETLEEFCKICKGAESTGECIEEAINLFKEKELVIKRVYTYDT